MGYDASVDGVSYECAVYNARTICEVGGHLVIVSIMNHYMQYERIVGGGCAVLGNIAYFGDFGKSPVVSVGGIQTILQAMKQYPNDPIIQDNGCNALSNLIHAKCPTIRERHANVLTCNDDYGTRIVIQAAKTFPDIPTLVVAICDMLETTCTHVTIRDSWNRSDAANTLMIALQQDEDVSQSYDNSEHSEEEIMEMNEMINRALMRLIPERYSNHTTTTITHHQRRSCEENRGSSGSIISVITV